MKIGIIGTRGIPNHYGGFEQFAESLSLFLVENGHEVYVYNSDKHPYKLKNYQGVHIIHKFDPEGLLGSASQFIYDLNCIIDSRNRGYDILLQLGYTSSSIWSFLFPKKPIVITNMDGLEWKRQKYTRLTRKFLKFAEKLAINNSDYHVADSKGIRSYLSHNYNIESFYIPYGSEIYSSFNLETLKEYNVEPYNYFVLIARMEPENNIDTILTGIVNSKTNKDVLIIGNTNNNYGRKLVLKYNNLAHIHFLEGIYNQDTLYNLRHFSGLYFHGHSVGGTNPSLLEAMGSGALILAHNNEFNKAILNDDAFYFDNENDISTLINKLNRNEEKDKVTNNLNKIKEVYNCEMINNEYLNLFYDCLSTNK